MSLSTNVSNLATRVATEVKTVKTQINGNVTDLSVLNTTTKTNLVAAINEVLGLVGAKINDATTSTTTTWSSVKTSSEISAAVAALVGSAPGALDTLAELAASLQNDEGTIASLVTSIGTKANTSDVVLLTTAQTVAGVKTFTSSPVVPDSSFAIAKVTGLQTALDSKASTTDVGSTTTNFVTVFEAGLV